jgi:hypothetical protein
MLPDGAGGTEAPDRAAGIRPGDPPGPGLAPRTGPGPVNRRLADARLPNRAARPARKLGDTPSRSANLAPRSASVVCTALDSPYTVSFASPEGLLLTARLDDGDRGSEDLLARGRDVVAAGQDLWWQGESPRCAGGIHPA